ncbi:MAG: MnmC family methyltransferase, partial [Candidatus Woesearchaeota archaeon]|nr:MnmC family methyltransferase [Candidatus Woesearchaeota archaeon]
VITFERDKNIIRMAEINPYSKNLFNMKNIKIVFGDVFEKIKEIKDEEFDIVLHDPPTPTLSPLLYSTGFYQQLLRVMKKNAVIYHYTPMPGNKKKKRDFPEEVKKRIAAVGFKDIKIVDYAQGIIARK